MSELLDAREVAKDLKRATLISVIVYQMNEVCTKHKSKVREVVLLPRKFTAVREFMWTIYNSKEHAIGIIWEIWSKFDIVTVGGNLTVMKEHARNGFKI